MRPGSSAQGDDVASQGAPGEQTLVLPHRPRLGSLVFPDLLRFPLLQLCLPTFPPPFSASSLNTGLFSPSSPPFASSFDLDCPLTWLSPLPIPKTELDPESLTVLYEAGMGLSPELKEIGGLEE